MQLQVALFVVGLLEQDIGADAGVLQLAVILHRGGGDVHVDATDVAVFIVNGVDRVDALQNIFDGIVHRIFPGFNGQALVSHVLESHDFRTDFLLGELFPGDMLVHSVIGTVDAAVDTVVGQVEGGKEDDAVAVEGVLDLRRQLVHLLYLFRNVAGQQDRGFPMGQAGAEGAVVGLLGTGLFQQLVNERHIVLVLLCIADGVQNFLVIDEFFCFERLGIIDSHNKHPFLWSRSLRGNFSVRILCGDLTQYAYPLGQ